MSEPYDGAERWQELVGQDSDLDDILVQVARGRLMKCAAISSAVAQGQDLYREGLCQVALYLQEVALEPLRELGAYEGVPRAEQLWCAVDEMPWPTLGGPRPQPD